jgi:hypothetical protein
MVDPSHFNEQQSLPATANVEVVPFSQLLQGPFNMAPYGGKFDIFAAWNHHLIKHVFPDLIQFIFGLADLPEPPTYATPPTEAVQKALDVVLDAMVTNQARFLERYNALTTKKEEVVHPVSWNLGAFLMSFFKDNVADSQ